MFDIKEFWKNYKEPPKEKINYWMMPVWILAWIGFKFLYFAPFVIGFYFFGNTWKGWIIGFTIFSIIFSLWAFLDSRTSDKS